MPGRRRLAEVYDRSLAEMQDVLRRTCARNSSTSSPRSPAETATESELRIAQAQLVGWLEGLFAGIQATLLHQQAAMATQLQEMRMRAIEAPPGTRTETPGQYL